MLLVVTLIPSVYGGYNISNQGGHDGEISTEPKGGSQPYTYAWSTGATTENIYELTAGNYSLILTDANGCTVTGSQTMTEPTPLHVVSITSPQHHGYNISCKGGNDGAINLSVTGGVPPYKYDWNTGSFDEDLSNLIAGEYSVRITDDNQAEIISSIVLTQPPGSLKVDLTPQIYANGFNLSCHDCSNGSLTAIGSAGVAPYTFLWSNGQTTATISGLQAIDYSCIITDVNGCTSTAEKTLLAPERDDWSMVGNANTNPTTQFIGTTDNKDVVFKTNNAERLKLKGNGDLSIHGNIKLDSLSSDTVQAVFVDQHGNLRRGPGDDEPQQCYKPAYAFYKKLCPPDNNYYFFGSTSGVSKLVIGNTTLTPGSYKLYVTGGILTEKLRIADPTTTFWADYVFDDNYKLQSLQEVKKFIAVKKHLPNIPSTEDVRENGIDVLEIQGKLLAKIEELTLHLISQEERIKELENKLFNEK